MPAPLVIQTPVQAPITVEVVAQDPLAVYVGVAPPTPQNVFIQDALPDTDLAQYLWVKTSDNPPTLWVEDGA